MFHLLFEQSGTFKKEFQKLGFKAEDYDILNDFNETDHVIDLFQEIEKAYNNEPSIFDNIDPDRREMGDYFKKPTQYFFINREPSNNFIFEAVDVKEKKIVHLTPDKVERSMISPDYANRFIREYILPPSKEED